MRIAGMKKSTKLFPLLLARQESAKVDEVLDILLGGVRERCRGEVRIQLRPNLPIFPNKKITRKSL